MIAPVDDSARNISTDTTGKTEPRERQYQRDNGIAIAASGDVTAAVPATLAAAIPVPFSNVAVVDAVPVRAHAPSHAVPVS